MVLQKLVEHYERPKRSGLLPALYAEGPVKYWINLDAQGRFLPPMVSSGGDPSNPRTRRGERRPLPQVQRSSGICPLLLADKADYTLGYVPDGKRADRVRNSHIAYLELVERCAAATAEPDVQAILHFLKNDPLDQVQPDESFDPSGIISFRVEENIVIDNPAVQNFWAEVNSEDDAPIMQCLVCGNRRPVLKRLQAKVKGIPGGQSAGTSLISANAAAFESYGLEASLTAPTCSKCGESFTRGLNDLLSRDKSRFRTGGSVYVFWTREETGFDFYSALEEPDPANIQALLESVQTGRPNKIDEERFYALSLSASAARATVRDWTDTTVGQVKKNLLKWFQGQKIVMLAEGPPRYYGLRALSFATVREPKELPVTTPRALTYAAFNGTSVPLAILAQAIRRNRAEQGVSRPRAALIKLALLSQTNKNEEDYMVQLDPGYTEPAYLCGRLMAVLEQAQQAAIRGIKTTVVDRFYGTASAAPLSVFPRLVNGAQPHLSKLKRDNAAAGFAINRKIEDILSQVKADKGFPRTLNLQQQGIFALGYYHQRAYDAAQSREASERRRSAREQENSGGTGEEDPEC